MNDDKYEKVLNVAIVLLIISAIVLLVSSYNYFYKNKKRNISTPIAKIANSKASQRDSLKQVYETTVNDIDKNITTDNALNQDKESQNKLAELSTLREEITSILKNNNAGDGDLTIAKIKIEELQIKVALLQNKYSGVESENKRLQALLVRLLASNKNNNSGSVGVTTSTRTNTPERTNNTVERNNYNTNATAAGLHLFAVTINNSKEQETTDSEEAEKMIGTFSLKNIANKPNGEVMIVVLQPDGKVVKNSVWETGTFETKEGKKVYSRKMYVDPSIEEKPLNFSLTPDTFIKGEYIMQVWYNGNMIAKTIKTMS
jgi:hypothetical protein